MTQEQENTRFEGLLKKLGAYKLEDKLWKLASVRAYFRYYHFDQWQKRTGLDAVDLVHPSNPLEEIISDEQREWLLEDLTPLERKVAEQRALGLKPRDIAASQGRSTSNAVRWLLWSIRQKMKAKLEA